MEDALAKLRARKCLPTADPPQLDASRTASEAMPLDLRIAKTR